MVLFCFKTCWMLVVLPHYAFTWSGSSCSRKESGHRIWFAFFSRLHKNTSEQVISVASATVPRIYFPEGNRESAKSFESGCCFVEFPFSFVSFLTFFLGCNKPQDLEKGKRSWILAINGWVSREAAKKDWYLHSTFDILLQDGWSMNKSPAMLWS